jgi:hypothetical protein
MCNDELNVKNGFCQNLAPYSTGVNHEQLRVGLCTSYTYVSLKEISIMEIDMRVCHDLALHNAGGILG